MTSAEISSNVLSTELISASQLHQHQYGADLLSRFETGSHSAAETVHLPLNPTNDNNGVT